MRGDIPIGPTCRPELAGAERKELGEQRGYAGPEI